ncbi:MAG: phosphate ABC transporter permease subunit PstC [Acidimicrobiales bacterium]
MYAEDSGGVATGGDLRALSVAPPPVPPPTPRSVPVHRSTPDRLFRGLTAVAGWTTLVVLGLIAVFLVMEARPALDVAGWDFLKVWEWAPVNEPAIFGIAAVLYGTVVAATIAILLAVPVAVGTALFVSEYVPVRVGRILTTLIDLLAAIPSLIYGMWGLYFLVPKLQGMQIWLADHLGFIPFFRNETGLFGRSMFDAGVVLALMVIPIVATVSREVMSQAPRVVREAALALGSTRLGMIRSVVLPFSRPGIIGGAMLGLGRALGETIAVALILSVDFRISPEITKTGGSTIASLIANNFAEAGELERHALIAAGLSLFVITLVVNMVARLIVSRAAKGSDYDR